LSGICDLTLTTIALKSVSIAVAGNTTAELADSSRADRTSIRKGARLATGATICRIEIYVNASTATVRKARLAGKGTGPGSIADEARRARFTAGATIDTVCRQIHASSAAIAHTARTGDGACAGTITLRSSRA
jgi:hypothetical protein